MLAKWIPFFFFLSFGEIKELKTWPPPPTPASERSTRPRPATQIAAPTNCKMEYFVPRKIHVRMIDHAMVQQSSIVTLVIDVNWYALLTAKSNFKSEIKSRIYCSLQCTYINHIYMCCCHVFTEWTTLYPELCFFFILRARHKSATKSVANKD